MTAFTKISLLSLLLISLAGCDKLNQLGPVDLQTLPMQAVEKLEVQKPLEQGKIVQRQAVKKQLVEKQLVEREEVQKKEVEKKGKENQSRPINTPQKTRSYKTIEWTDLMPKDDFEAFMNPPEYITDIEDGSLEDQLSNQMANAIGAASDDRYQQALVSTKVIKAMDGKAIRLPGFIVPLEFDDNQIITQFFLVPFFGACIHLPPPPPNQTILVNYPKGLKLATLVDPLWISGVLKVSLTKNDMATAAYTLEMDKSEEYNEP